VPEITREAQHKYQVTPPLSVSIYTVVSFVGLLLAGTFLLYISHQLTLPQHLLYIAQLVIGLATVGAISEGKPWARPLELCRFASLFGTLALLPQPYQMALLLGFALHAVLFVLLVGRRGSVPSACVVTVTLGNMAKRSPEKSSSRGGLLLPGQSRRASRIYRIVRTVVLLLLLLGCLAVTGVAALFLYYSSDPSLPTIDKIADYRPKVTTRVLASDGQLIGEIFEERRTVIPRERIPRVIVDAFVDAEDAQFFEHHGLNYIGMFRAVLQSLWQGRHLRGASTLTQQLVKTYVLKSSERSLKRKVQEMYLALRLEKMLSKEEILWLYLSQIYFGHGRYGIEEAARYYFGKSVTDVHPGEAALLASLPKGPEEISPRRNAERAKLRQRYVLSQMARYHHLSDAEAVKWAEAPIQLVKEPPPQSSLAPEFVDEVDKLLIERFGAERLPYLGLNVRTTCNLDVQRAARAALEQGLQRIDERNKLRQGLRKLDLAARTAHLAELKREFPSGPPVGRGIDGVVIKVLDGDKGSGWAMVGSGRSPGLIAAAADG
jgi:hypothetical protein